MNQKQNTFEVKNRNSVQYIFSIVISLLFGVSLIPGNFGDMGGVLVIMILVQILISILKFNLLHLILEFVLLIFAILSFIPYLGYLFILIGFVLSLLDLVTFKNSAIYKQVNVRFDTSFSNKKKSQQKEKKVKHSKDVVDAEFKEK